MISSNLTPITLMIGSQISLAARECRKCWKHHAKLGVASESCSYPKFIALSGMNIVWSSQFSLCIDSVYPHLNSFLAKNK